MDTRYLLAASGPAVEVAEHVSRALPRVERAPARPAVLVLGPGLAAASGVSAHLKTLFASTLARDFELIHFQVGSEGRTEHTASKVLRLIASPFVMARRIRRHRARVVHINTSLNRGAFWRDLMYLAVAKLCGVRVLYQVHGGALPQDFFRGSRLFTGFLRAVLGCPDTIVVLARVELAAYRRFLPQQHLVVVPNGIDSDAYAAVTRHRFNGQRPLRVLYLGRLAAEKGVYELLRSQTFARALGTNARITFAGVGPEEATLRRLTTTLGLDDRVCFAGPVHGERKLQLYASADVLVLATYHEGLPYALLEGMAAGAVVVTTRVGGIPDVVIDGVHGLFVPTRDAVAIACAILRLQSDSALLTRMSAACRLRIASHYSAARMAGAFHTLYSDLAATPRLATGGL